MRGADSFSIPSTGSLARPHGGGGQTLAQRHRSLRRLAATAVLAAATIGAGASVLAASAAEARSPHGEHGSFNQGDGLSGRHGRHHGHGGHYGPPPPTPEGVQTVATGLNQPKKLTVAPDGSLLVALSGDGTATSD
jgi:hypothetical protein